MATKKTVKTGKTEPSSKTVSTEVVAPKAKKVKVVKSKVRLVSFTVAAVIPTQSYGNIQPSITVEAPTIEEARAVVMPVVEEMIRTYAETKPGFLGRVEMKETIVTPAKPVELTASPAPTATASSTPASPVSTPPATTSLSTSTATPKAPISDHPAVMKAEKAISIAATQDAVNVIQKQIENSEKIPKEFKSALVELCYAKFNSLKA